jgi:hypothetical protein
MVLRNLILVLVIFVITNSFGQTSPRPGTVDATLVNFNEDRLNLSGSWLWYDNKLLSPAELKYNDAVPIDFPGTWNTTRANESGQGAATYGLTVILPKGTEQLALDIPQVYSSYILFVDGKEVARNGTPGETPETTTPQWRPQIVPLTLQSDTVQLTMQIANFSHHKGGLKEPLVLSSESMLDQKEFLSTNGKLLAVGLLFSVAIVFLFIFFRSGHKIIVIYFSLLCITWAVRSLFSNDYLAIKLLPDFDWNTMVRMEYITLYLTMIWAILFLVSLFKNEGNNVMKYLLVAMNCAFIVYTVATPALEFTKLLPLYLGTAGVLLVYGAGIILVALINERKGATYLTISVLLGLIIFSYDIFTYEGWFSYNSILFSAGYLAIFVLMGGALLVHLDIIKGASTATTMLTYKDLYGEEGESKSSL